TAIMIEFCSSLILFLHCVGFRVSHILHQECRRTSYRRLVARLGNMLLHNRSKSSLLRTCAVHPPNHPLCHKQHYFFSMTISRKRTKPLLSFNSQTAIIRWSIDSHQSWIS